MDSGHSGESLPWTSFLLQPFRTLMGLGTSSICPIDSNCIYGFSYLSVCLCVCCSLVTCVFILRESLSWKSFIPSSPSSRPIYKYDVFISFRGTDTRNNFVDHLYAHLLRKGVFAFKDDEKLEQGKPISSQLKQAIKDSRVSIIVFSKDYAGSTWCLEEMATIAQCQKELKQTVFSVFYGVDPSHVRKQSGVYENAFVLHRKNFKKAPGKVDGWERAMTDLANSVGWDVRDKPESREIEKIAQKVIKTLGHKFSGFADDIIGIQSRVEGLQNLLKLSSDDDDFRVLGIWGMGGIGKTTHATVLYDKISYQFSACCFIENVSKIYRDGGAVSVQKQILRQTIDEKSLETYSPSEISGIIINRLSHIKVLIVLDDVDQLEQLQELAIRPKSLHGGSRIIITTRDVNILKVYGVDEVHEVLPLNDNDAHELFCQKAFKIDDASSSSCMELTPEVLKYAQNLPLAIKVIGSSLCTRDVTEWRATLDELRDNPNQKIMNVLQTSFVKLQRREREIFLHIACFFKGEREDYVRRILNCCGLNPDNGILLLSEKSLITFRNQEIHMHEMLQELGKNIVREQFPEKQGSWSRLWHYEDFHHVMITETGTNDVEAIVLDQKEDVFKCNRLRAEELSKMKGLKLLILYHKNFSGSLENLSNSLRFLLWHGYPFPSLPSNFQPDRLVELNMPDSSIVQLWNGIKHLPNLKRVDLSNSKYLIKTPNFEGIPNLERLDLTGCTKLSQVHASIGFLRKLAFLSLRNCSSLAVLYLGRVSDLCSLIILDLSGCTELKTTRYFTGLSDLEYLDLKQCASLSTVDESIGALTKLKFLSLRDCTNLDSIPNSVNDMKSLITLDLGGCFKLRNVPLGQTLRSSLCLQSLIVLDVGFGNLHEVPAAIGELKCLERLNLEGNNFVSLPSTISQLFSLAYLNLSHCHELRSLPQLPSRSASSVGRYFKTVSGSRNHRSGLYIFNCTKLKLIDAENNEHLAVLWLRRLAAQPCHFRCGFDIVIPGSVFRTSRCDKFKGGSIIRIADWPDPCVWSSILLDPNKHLNWDWAACCFFLSFEVNYHSTISGSSHNSFSMPLPHPLYLSFESECTEERFDMPLRLDLDKIDGSKYLWLIYISSPHCHFLKTGARVTFKASPGLEIKEWGLCPPHLYGERIRYRLGRQNERLVPQFRFDYVDERRSSSYFGPKIQLPYNWLVTEEEENENMEAKEKENNLSNMGL